MQVIFKNEDERSCSKEANSVDTIICAGGNSRYSEGKCIRRFGDRNIGIQNNRGILGRLKERVWRRGREND